MAGGAYRRRALAAACAAVAWVAAAASVAAAAGPPAQPYGFHDAGGFRNVLPAGENGTDSAAQLAAFEATGQRPPHSYDQLGLYTGLLYAQPHLTHAGVARYYKDATFGVRPGDVESTTSPAPGVTIVRDRGYGIPHVYGATRSDVEFGAGYAGAGDRLFLMDVLRHFSRAQLSSFIGGSAGNREMDRTQWAIAPYTEADLQSQLDAAPRLYGAAGRRVVADVKAYVAGINRYIANAKLGLATLPGEYAALGKLPQPWTPTDVIAEASLIGGIFGKGGGAEVQSALTLQAFERRFGERRGRRLWRDFRDANDPAAPTTARRAFPYETGSPFAPRGLALPDRGSVRLTPVAPPVGRSAAAASAGARGLAGIGAALSQLSFVSHTSNALLVSARHSSDRHPIAVIGPQVGYYAPQILMEEELHGPGFDARGAAFPGVNLYVELGHGRDYAWSATSAGSDNVDTFAEVLCRDGFHYRYKGRCLAMRRLERTNRWTPNASDMTPAGSETLTAYRTVHGIVYARGRVHGRRVAFVSARTTYFHEADSALGFSQLNDPGYVRGPRSFQRAASHINFTFNWFYTDARRIAYYQSGAYPIRTRGSSPDFPILGTGAYDWRGYDPRTHTERKLGYAAHPNALDPAYLVSWNNKEAPRWAAADDNYAYGSIYRSQLLSDKIAATIRRGRKVTLQGLVSDMESAGTQDVREVKLLPAILRALGHPRGARLRHAVALLRTWGRAGGHRRDLNRDGQDEHEAAIALLDAWWPKLVAAEFEPRMGRRVYRALQRMQGLGTEGFGAPRAPNFSTGWYSYVRSDLRDVFGPRVRDPLSRKWCGGGSRARCRAALRRSLTASLRVSRATLYGHGDCAGSPDSSCYDQNRSVEASAVTVPPFPFINRPTFQQTVELRRKLSR